MLRPPEQRVKRLLSLHLGRRLCGNNTVCTESNGFLKSQGRGLPSSKLSRNSGARHLLGLARQWWPVSVTTDSPEVVCTVPRVHPWPLLSARCPRLGQRSGGLQREYLRGAKSGAVSLEHMDRAPGTYVSHTKNTSSRSGQPDVAFALPLCSPGITFLLRRPGLNHSSDLEEFSSVKSG